MRNIVGAASVRALLAAACRVGLAATAVLVTVASLPPSPAAVSGQTLSPPAAEAPRRTNIPYADAKPILETLRPDLLPAPLGAMTPSQRVSAWPDWVARHDEDIRARLARGDEDSVLNLTLFGTTFTKVARVTERDIADVADGLTVPNQVRMRIEDMMTGIVSPRGNERLEFARSVAERVNGDPGAAGASNRIRKWLEDGIRRVVAEYGTHAGLVHNPAASDADRSTLYHDRGLASDTLIFPGFGVEQALQSLMSNHLLDGGSLRRVAVVGPGLDFVDKREGYDFYPQQTIQPFAVMDSLIRLGLAAPDTLRLTTLDLSPRINHHLEAARQRARAGDVYTLQLPRGMDLFQWTPFLSSYWETFGDRIGTAASAIAVPPEMVRVQLRAVRIRPDVVNAVTPRDVNIVLQRLEPLPDGELFDLVIATNVLVYYDVFEQQLALTNVAKMLRPKSFLLTNEVIAVLPAVPMDLRGYTEVGYTSRPEGDRLFWYQRQ